MLSNCGPAEDSRVPGAARRSNQAILKGINPEYSLEGLILKLKLQYFGHLMRRADSLEKTLMLGNLDSIFKSRDITLPTKVHLVKAMVFPVVMYGCESWTIKKAECQRIDAFVLWCWRRLLRVPWQFHKSFTREINFLEYFLSYSYFLYFFRGYFLFSTPSFLSD